MKLNLPKNKWFYAFVITLAVLVVAAVVGVIGIVGICTRVRRDLRIRRIYANRYAARLKAERLKRSHADA